MSSIEDAEFISNLPINPPKDMNLNKGVKDTCRDELISKFSQELKIYKYANLNEMLDLLCSKEVLDIKKRMAKYHFKRIDEYGLEKQFHAYKNIIQEIKRWFRS